MERRRNEIFAITELTISKRVATTETFLINIIFIDVKVNSIRFMRVIRGKSPLKVANHIYNVFHF